uniref:thiamin biosynthesis protein G n=1 Tax=Haramonas pauciplastida TaxID=478668 RepID=UPI0021145B2D|nr:thiamin biosynthesis protein G [Haramonas pauciplastida]UTE95049.1 thiamin biosynthesis protein G [Haramonas pauciplastida]
MNDNLKIGNKTFNSRLMLGTGKYFDTRIALESIKESEAEIITVAVRRISSKNFSLNLEDLNSINWNKYWLLPNTAGSKTVDEAIRAAFLGRELATQLGQGNNNFVKLEVISDPTYLLPDPVGTLNAADFLVKNGFTVLPYINADPILAKHLEDVGCATIMPLASPIGSGQGIKNLESLRIIIKNSKIPVIVDAGIGRPSDAVKAMEIGSSGILLNTAIAQARNPPLMARAIKDAVLAGRNGFLAGSITEQKFAQASSPLSNLIL